MKSSNLHFFLVLFIFSMVILASCAEEESNKDKSVNLAEPPSITNVKVESPCISNPNQVDESCVYTFKVTFSGELDPGKNPKITLSNLAQPASLTDCSSNSVFGGPSPVSLPTLESLSSDHMTLSGNVTGGTDAPDESCTYQVDVTLTRDGEEPHTYSNQTMTVEHSGGE